MARKRIPLRKLKETLRLRFDLKLSERVIARSVRVAPSTVHRYLERAEEAGIGWPVPDGMDDEALERLLYERPERSSSQSSPRPLPDWRQVHKELRSGPKGVTLQLLWEEYRVGKSNAYSYSRFCELYRE